MYGRPSRENGLCPGKSCWLARNRDGSTEVVLNPGKPGWIWGNRSGSEGSQPGSGENVAWRAEIGPPREKSVCVRPPRIGFPGFRLVSRGIRPSPRATSHALETAARLPGNRFDSGDSGPCSREIGLFPETSFRLPPNPPDLEGPRRVIAGARLAWRDAARGPGIRPDLSRRSLRVSGSILISPRTAAFSRDTARCGGIRRSRRGRKALSGEAAPAPAGLRRRRGKRGRSLGIHAGVPGLKPVSPDTRRCRRIWRTVSLVL